MLYEVLIRIGVNDELIETSFAGIDVQGPEGPYKWAGVSAMSATQAIANAESLAYLGESSAKTIFQVGCLLS